LKNSSALRVIIALIFTIIVVLSLRESVFFISPPAVHHDAYRYTSMVLFTIAILIHLISTIVIARAEHVVSPQIVKSAPLTSKMFTVIALNLYAYTIIDMLWYCIPLGSLPPHLQHVYGIMSFVIFVLLLYLVHFINAILLVIYLVKVKNLSHEGDVLATISSSDSSSWSHPTSPEHQGLLQGTSSVNGHYYVSNNNNNNNNPYDNNTAAADDSQYNNMNNNYNNNGSNSKFNTMSPLGVEHSSSFQYVFPPQRKGPEQQRNEQQGPNPYVVEYYHQQQQIVANQQQIQLQQQQLQQQQQQQVQRQQQQAPVHYYKYQNEPQ